MARENVGTLSAVVTADTSEFSVKLAQAETRVDKFSKTVVSSGNAMNASAGGMRKSQFALQQLAFGAEDAASVYGTMGLAGAIRASSNNLSQFASIIHPLAGVVAGFAGAGLSILVNNMEKTSKATKEAKEELRDFSDLLATLDERQRDRMARIDKVDFGADSKTLEDQRSELKREMTKTNTEMQRQQDEIIALAKPFVGDVIELINPRQLTPRTADDSPFSQILGAVDGAALNDVPKQVMERIRDAEREIFKMNNDLGRAVNQSEKLNDAVKVAREREGQEAHEKGIADALENHAKKQEQFNDMLEEAARLEKEITAEIDPQAGKQQKIADELEGRVNRIRDLIPAIGQDEANRLIEQAQKASQLAQGKQQELKADAPLPQAAIRGTSQALSSINRAATRTNAPEQQTAKNTASIAKSSTSTAKAVQKLAKQPQVKIVAGKI